MQEKKACIYGLGLLVLSLIFAAGCSRKGTEGQQAEPVLEVTTVEHHNALTALDAQIEADAHALHEAAKAQKFDKDRAKELAGDLSMSLNAAKSRHSELERQIRAKEKARLGPLHQAIDAAYAKATEQLGQLETELAKPSANKDAVARHAKAIHDEIIQAESKHLEIKAQRAESDEVEFVDIVVYRDHETLKGQLKEAARHARAIQDSSTKTDWKRVFQQEADKLKERLEAAKAYLAKMTERIRPSERATGGAYFEAVQQHEAKAMEHLEALQKELAKAKPNQEAAKKHAAAIHEEIQKAEQENEQMKSLRGMQGHS